MASTLPGTEPGGGARDGLGALQRARVGSISTKVVRAAEGPVLVYPHARAGEEANGG